MFHQKDALGILDVAQFSELDMGSLVTERPLGWSNCSMSPCNRESTSAKIALGAHARLDHSAEAQSAADRSCAAHKRDVVSRRCSGATWASSEARAAGRHRDLEALGGAGGDVDEGADLQGFPATRGRLQLILQAVLADLRQQVLQLAEVVPLQLPGVRILHRVQQPLCAGARAAHQTRSALEQKPVGIFWTQVFQPPEVVPFELPGIGVLHLVQQG